MKSKQISCFLLGVIAFFISSRAISQTIPDTTKEYKELLRKLRSRIVYPENNTTPTAIKTDSANNTFMRDGGQRVCITTLIIDGVKICPTLIKTNDMEVERFLNYTGNIPAQYDNWSSWFATTEHPFYVREPQLWMTKPSIPLTGNNCR